MSFRVSSWFQFGIVIWNHELTRNDTKLFLTSVRVFILISTLVPVVAAQHRKADLVVINAKVRTIVTPTATAEAFAVSGKRITAVGTTRSISKYIGPSTRVIDADGRLVLPGFNDAHVHFMAIGNTFSSLDLRYVTAADEMTRQISRYARFLPKGRWILGGNFRSENLTLPNKKALDEASPNNPVFLYAAGASSAIANSAAFRLAGLKNDHPGVDHDTGIVRGGALERIRAVVPKDHTTNWLELGETATNLAASLGVTSVQDMHSDDSRAVYRELERQGKLKTRVYDCVPLRDWKKLLDSRLSSRPDDLVTDGCLKSFSDGEAEAKPALLRDVIAVDKAGLQIMIHAIGRAANEIVLDVFEQTAKTNGPRDRRFRVEHAHNVRDEDLHRFTRAKIIASMQPFLFDGSDGSRYGTLLRQKAPVAFGSDASMVDLNPLLGIDAAVNAGDEAISVYEAVRAYTLGSAYSEFREREKGTIEPGKLADFVILSDDIFTVDHDKRRGAFVVMTVVNGNVVFESSH